MNGTDNALLINSADKLFSDLASRQAAAMEVRFDRDGWDLVEGSGFCDLLRSVAAGGAGCTAVDFHDVANLAGRYGLDLPVVTTVIARALLDEIGIRVPAGALMLGFGVNAGDMADGFDDALQFVSFDADLPVVAVKMDLDGAEIRLISGGGVAARNIAGHLVTRLSPSDVAQYDAVPFPLPVAQRYLNLAALGQAAQISGALQHVLDMTVQYVCDRSIFGKKMKGFQAIQHLVAVATEEVCATVAITQAAAASFEEPMRPLLVAAARVRAADAIDVVNSTAHQLHGAMGFTLEFPLQRWTKLLWSWRDQYGSAAAWRRKVGRAFLGLEADELWPNLLGTARPTIRVE